MVGFVNFWLGLDNDDRRWLFYFILFFFTLFVFKSESHAWTQSAKNHGFTVFSKDEKNHEGEWVGKNLQMQNAFQCQIFFFRWPSCCIIITSRVYIMAGGAT
jgi:hypothetical protein